MLWLGWRLPLRGYQQRAAGLRCTAKSLLWLRQQRCAHAPPTLTSGASVIPDSIVAVLREGGAVVYPTSTLPGLGCLPHAAALDRLFALKKRKEKMVVSLGVASLQQASELVHVPRGAAEMLGAFPAGSLTLILRARAPLDPRLGGEAVAVRVFGPDSALARCLVEKMGPITATSANISGVDSATDCASAGESLGLPPSAIVSHLHAAKFTSRMLTFAPLSTAVTIGNVSLFNPAALGPLW